MYKSHVQVHNRQYWPGIKCFLCLMQCHAQVLTRYKTSNQYITVQNRQYWHGIKRFLCSIIWIQVTSKYMTDRFTRYKTFHVYQCIQCRSKYITNSINTVCLLCISMYTNQVQAHNRQYWHGIKRFLCLSMYTSYVQVHNRQYWSGIKRFVCSINVCKCTSKNIPDSIDPV